MDYREDLAARLPSFLTAATSLTQAMELTAAAARHYGASVEQSSRHRVVPLRSALYVITALTRIIIRVAGRTRHSAQTLSLDGLERETHR